MSPADKVFSPRPSCTMLTITLILSTKMYFSPLQSCRTRPGTTRTSTWTSSSTSTRTSRPTTPHHHHKCLLPWMCKPLHLHNYLLPWMCLVLSLTGPGLATHHHVLTPEISSKFPQDPRISRTKLSKVEFLKCNIIFSILTGARQTMWYYIVACNAILTILSYPVVSGSLTLPFFLRCTNPIWPRGLREYSS